MGRLDDRVAIITGGAQGQGAATARLFLNEGARIVIADVREDEGKALAEELGERACFIRLDVSDEANWQSAIGSITDRWNTIDVLINNAGIVHIAALVEMERKDFQRVLDVNLIGPWLGIKAVAPVMIAQCRGSIVNILSTGALWSMNSTGAYMAAKWGLRGLTKNAAMELGWQGVRVNGVFPGGVNTPFANIGNKSTEEMNKLYVGQTIQRIGEPEEIAEASLFLASDASSYMAGSELTVDGGMTLGVFHDYLPGAPPNASEGQD
ncbi:3-alpha-hydroxysteroid dehydrogenase [Novosphingobium marinum]|uniref:3alpha(Or 20beta)-hydroxysteroid dehydrogenase n=1 Tax=Novosphingobium marinum TaxID=1514948 RepID=A0A7Z0BT24_9SPHN|nr:glucose 1-dehydrogenase [Novosphingobium marinum]NYH95511.1 3alpha(or 20beta)-hydroxysteroid dehydrogenase [Novosphingobium marinum]GGC27620.1 3-alpha-hydroxysteroid dehydrogenase [Novosphingobium marinum]